MPTIITDGKRTLIEVPSSKVLKDRLSQVLHEAAQLQVVLKLASELEAAEYDLHRADQVEKGASRD